MSYMTTQISCDAQPAQEHEWQFELVMRLVALVTRDDAMRLAAIVKGDHVLHIAREVDAAFAAYTDGMPPR